MVLKLLAAASVSKNWIFLFTTSRREKNYITKKQITNVYYDTSHIRHRMVHCPLYRHLQGYAVTLFLLQAINMSLSSTCRCILYTGTDYFATCGKTRNVAYSTMHMFMYRCIYAHASMQYIDIETQELLAIAVITCLYVGSSGLLVVWSENVVLKGS